MASSTLPQTHRGANGRKRIICDDESRLIFRALAASKLLNLFLAFPARFPYAEYCLNAACADVH